VPAGAIEDVPVGSKPAMGIFQAARQCVLFSRHGDQMNVIGHQAIADQIGSVSLHALMEQIEVNVPFGIPFQDKAPCIATLRDVVWDVLRNNSGKSNHWFT
jgi:ATP-dependent protease Clp ATPase subunit